MRRFPYFASTMLAALTLVAGCSSSSTATLGDAGRDASLSEASPPDVTHPGHDATNPGHDANGGTDAKGKVDTGVDAPPAANCTDGVMDGTETGVDCGGGQCPACGNGQTCVVSSDCASTVCSSGACADCVTATDCKASASLCLVATCTGDTCGTSNAATGTACSDNGGAVCSASGTCVACNVDSDCPGDGLCANNTCSTATCSDGVKDGSETGVDCGGTQCDALGKTCPAGSGCGSASDCTSPAACSGATYTPPTACTGGLCVAGVSKACAGPDGLCNAAVGCVQCNASTDCAAASCNGSTFTPAATCTANACVPSTSQSCTGATPVCNAADGCVQCNTVADCPAATACSTPTCTNNVCGTTNVPMGTALPSGQQTKGDCQELVCNGSGSVTSVDDAGDVPGPAPTVCQTHPACSGSPLTPSYTPAPTGTDCTSDSDPSAFVCGDTSSANVAGACVECNTDSDCLAVNDAGTLTCNTANGTCQ